MTSDIHAGQTVKAMYKTGEYIGELLSFSERSAKAKVRILAVLKHPQQGDIHHHMDPDVALFHQRKALAFQEVALIPIPSIRRYEGEIPAYDDSLRQSYEQALKNIEKTARWAELCKQQLLSLRADYPFEDG